MGALSREGSVTIAARLWGSARRWPLPQATRTPPARQDAGPRRYRGPMMPTSPPTGPVLGGPAAASPPEPPRGRSPVLVGLAATVVVVLLVVTAGWALVATASSTPVATGPQAGMESSDPGVPSSSADAWDPRLEPLADFVASTRGRPFLQPVPVRFLSDADFREAIVGASEEPTEERSESLDISTAQLRALDLIGRDVDLAAEADQLVGEGTLAYYDSEADAITIRGEELDPMTEVSVVHELTHAWQDQYFDLDRIDGDDDVLAATLRTVVEGDATVVEDRYIETFSDAERQEYERRLEDVTGAVTDGLADVPDVLQSIFVSPYVIGPGLVRVFDAEGGNPTVDEALVDPPASEMETLQPERYLAGDTPVTVSAPALFSGQEELDTAPFGALSLLVTLAQRLEPQRSLAVVDGWAGDSALTYREGDRRCVAVAVAGVDPGSTDAFAGAFGDWASAGPAGAASVERSGDTATLRSCEVDQAPVEVGQPARLALQYVALRLDVFRQVLEQPRTTPEQAACFAELIVAQVPPTELIDPSGVTPDVARRRGTQAAIECLN